MMVVVELEMSGESLIDFAELGWHFFDLIGIFLFYLVWDSFVKCFMGR